MKSIIAVILFVSVGQAAVETLVRPSPATLPYRIWFRSPTCLTRF